MDDTSTTKATTEEPKSAEETNSKTPDTTTNTGESTEAKADDTTDSEKNGDGAHKALVEERKARKDAEKALKEAQKRLKDIDDRDLTEAQKVERERDEYKQKLDAISGELRSAKAERSFSKAIKAENIPAENVDLVLELVRRDEWDEEDDNSRDLVKAVVKKYPNLSKPTGGSGDAGAGKAAAPKNTRAQAGAWLRQS